MPSYARHAPQPRSAALNATPSAAHSRTRLSSRAAAILDSAVRAASLDWKYQFTAITAYPTARAAVSATVTHGHQALCRSVTPSGGMLIQGNKSIAAHSLKEADNV